MPFKSIFSSLFLLLIIIFSSCKDHNEYRIDSEFTEYLQRFETIAATHKDTFNVKAEGLIIEFANLKDNTAGLTHYEDPIRIEIDQTYWNEISTTAGADQMKEDLIFHELGHGLLNRAHLNTSLENGDWKSIMCGGDKVNDRAWNINYHGVRRAYYLDELFNESTPSPTFASQQFLADTTGFSVSRQLSFDTPAQSGLAIVDNNQYKTSIDNGRLSFQSKVSDVYLVYLRDSLINLQTDFSYQLTIQASSSDANDQYGLVFGTVLVKTTSYPESVDYFTINNIQKMYMGNRTWYSFFTELTKPIISINGKNTLKVFKISGMLYYFINNQYCYSNEMVGTDPGNHFGFMVPPKGTVWLDNLIICQKKGASKSSKVMRSLPAEFEVTTVKSLNQKSVLNK
ncbi:MAG: hypothetical protein WCG93_13810 [Paludibacter sp.]